MVVYITTNLVDKMVIVGKGGGMTDVSHELRDLEYARLGHHPHPHGAVSVCRSNAA